MPTDSAGPDPAATDPVLARVRALALALPGAREKASHARPAFYTTRVFAYYGGYRRVGGSWALQPQGLLIRPEDDAEAQALAQDPRFWVPAHLGPAGWLGLDLPDSDAAGADTDWTEIGELITGSFLRTAPRSLIARLPEP